MALLEQAAGQGHAYAMDVLGSIYSQRDEHEQAMGWCVKAAEAGLPDAMFYLGGMLEEGLHVATLDYPAAADWYLSLIHI